MSKKDTVTKAFMRENTVFADAFNYLIFNGKKVIQPEQLQELDTTELVQLIAKGKNNKNESVQKYRDILKATVIMEDENADYLLLGIENQTEIHYAMPVRNMIYDALQYGNQVAAIAAQNVKEKKAPTRAEFLSGFYKADKLRPVITLVLHFGADPWDGATSLHEMMDFPWKKCGHSFRTTKFISSIRQRLNQTNSKNFQPVCGKCSAVLSIQRIKKNCLPLSEIIQE